MNSRKTNSELSPTFLTSQIESGLFGRKTTTLIKFIFSEKATKFCEISTIDLSYVVPVKSTVEILQNFVVFSEYVNFKQFYW